MKTKLDSLGDCAGAVYYHGGGGGVEVGSVGVQVWNYEM